jgi:TonB family protein
VTSYLQALALSALIAAASSLAHAQGAEPAPAQTPPPASSPSPAQAALPVPADSTQLEVIQAPPPYYPLEAAAKGLVRGQVVIQLHISQSGIVDNTDIISGDPLLAKAASDAMMQWTFKPFIKDGKPVRVSRKVPYEFTLSVKSDSPCAAVEAAVAVNAVNPQRDHVSQEIMEGKRIHGVDPVYPIAAHSKGVQGDVVVQAVIGADGGVYHLKALCGPKELIAPSLDAVRQWRYSPYLDGGIPTAVTTTIQVKFRM